MSAYVHDFHASRDPAAVRKLLLSYYRALDAADAESADLARRSAPLADRVALRAVRADILVSIDRCNRFLRRVARLGGRGLPPPALTVTVATAAGADEIPAATDPAVGTLELGQGRVNLRAVTP